MCLSVPARVLEIDDDHAVVDYGEGTTRKVNIRLVEPSPGDYVLVHAGFVIQIIDEDEARSTLELFDEMVE